jgi:3-hydroxybutyryl-CoA dehydratase
MQPPLSFDDVKPGDIFHSPTRTITETDVVMFAGMTGDINPLHVDHEYARSTPFGKPIAHGLLGLSFVAGLGCFSPWMHTAAFMGIREWKFLKPLFIGDTVHVRTEVLTMTPKGRRHGQITWQRSLINQAGEVVQEGTFETLVKAGGEALRLHGGDDQQARAA